MPLSRFNIRVYGLLLHGNKILLTEEQIDQFSFTKFPGGGLELGEGLHDGLKREFMEETGLEINIEKHIYTTDFFQQSAFKPSDQLISVYYRVQPVSFIDERFEIAPINKAEKIRFVWVDKDELNEDMLTFPIDKKVCSLIKETLLFS